MTKALRGYLFAGALYLVGMSIVFMTHEEAVIELYILWKTASLSTRIWFSVSLWLPLILSLIVLIKETGVLKRQSISGEKDIFAKAGF